MTLRDKSKKIVFLLNKTCEDKSFRYIFLLHSRLISSHIIARMCIRIGRKFAFQNKEERKAFYFILFSSNLFYGVHMLRVVFEKKMYKV